MINEENKTQIITSYLEGNLDEKDTKEVEKKIAQDPEFKLEVELQRALFLAIREEDAENFKKELEQIHQEHFGSTEQPNTFEVGESDKSDNTTPVRSIPIIKAIAAALILLILSVAIIYLTRSTNEDTSGLVLLSKKLPVYEYGSNGFAYIQGDDNQTDSLTLQIISDQEYINQYHFKDTLKLYIDDINAEQRNFMVEYDNISNTYYLSLDTVRYQLERGFSQIFDLEPLED
ncbi:hypothetical protein QQ008_20875 [Fulvivirgaceae bacterium BMA10]|uniref:Anti-sigma factor n=1 Tax=Splendidivirga corallicola TaxID=3051826 RepID=A0ABT8KUQ2_9BACT|nr:hypothetical protein [Fulvivirgaceae bacterium BMA10]